MKSFLNKPTIKNIILSVLTLAIGGICSAMGSWNFKDDTFIKAKITALSIIGIIYLLSIIFYSIYEINTNKLICILKKENDAFENSISGLISICNQSSSDVNSIIQDIIKSNTVNLKIWNFDKSCTWICRQLYDNICLVSGNKKDFSINYVRLNNENNDQIYINAFYNKSNSKPTAYVKKRNYHDDIYFDSKIFRDNISDIVILESPEIINDEFNYENNEKRKKNKDKYKQYIGIPVFCNNEKMIGLLQICCYNNCMLANTKDELNDITIRYFKSYSDLLLLFYKIEKILLVIHEYNNEKGDNNEKT